MPLPGDGVLLDAVDDANHSVSTNTYKLSNCIHAIREENMKIEKKVVEKYGSK